MGRLGLEGSPAGDGGGRGAGTGTDVGSTNEWRIDDHITQLRVRGSDTVFPLPPTFGDLTIGAADGCWLRLADPRVSRLHARLVRQDGRWGIKDLRSKNGVREDGIRRDAFMLAPGTEIGIGGQVLIAESPRLCALRDLLTRLIGWPVQLRGEIDLALRAVRMAALRRERLLLCGEGDLVAIARMLHRHTHGEERVFVMCDPKRGRTARNVRMEANFEDGYTALARAEGGTLCVWQDRLPEGFAEMVAAIRERTARVQLVVCSHQIMPAVSLVASPVVIPPLAQREFELDRIIDAHVMEAQLELGGGALLPGDREWLRSHEAATLPQIDVAVRRLIAIRASGSIMAAATRLGMSRAALAEWVQRRKLNLHSGD